MFAIAVLTLTWDSALEGVRSPDRSALLTALDERVLTGFPKHLDHDEGQDLQAAVTAALAANPNDSELGWAAVRASFAMFAHVSPVFSDAKRHTRTATRHLRHHRDVPGRTACRRTVEQRRPRECVRLRSVSATCAAERMVAHNRCDSRKPPD